MRIFVKIQEAARGCACKEWRIEGGLKGRRHSDTCTPSNCAGETAALEVKPDFTVSETCAKIQKRLGIAARHCLIFAGKRLDHGRRTLSDCGIGTGSTVLLVPMRRGVVYLSMPLNINESIVLSSEPDLLCLELLGSAPAFQPSSPPQRHSALEIWLLAELRMLLKRVEVLRRSSGRAPRLEIAINDRAAYWIRKFCLADLPLTVSEHIQLALAGETRRRGTITRSAVSDSDPCASIFYTQVLSNSIPYPTWGPISQAQSAQEIDKITQEITGRNLSRGRDLVAQA